MLKLFSKLTLFFCLSQTTSVYSQYTFQPSSLPEEISLHPYAKVAVTGDQQVSLQAILDQPSSLNFQPISGPDLSLGFTEGQAWVTFGLKNHSSEPIHYYLETGRPITDKANLYLVADDGKAVLQQSGDALPFNQRVFGHRKSIFHIDLAPGENVRAYLMFQSDGEVINVPLKLRSPENLILSTYREQLFFGLFYGILVLAAITYFFFYFALRDRSFLEYSFYVVFVGLLQFSLDGHFYQYLAPGGGWFSLRAVLIFATLSTFFFGRYNQVFLKIKEYSRPIYTGFLVNYGLVAVSFVLLICSPQILPFLYPFANVLGLGMLVLALSSLIYLKANRHAVDIFFATGILCLVAGFTVFILNNFGAISNSFFVDNSTKFGTGLEVIFLSLSMANRIRLLKSEKEKMQALALKRAEEMNEVKSFFLSNMSHELRTPLNAIMGLADVMLKDTADEKVRDHCEVIKYASVSLLSSVNDILDFSKIEKNELTLDKVDFEPAEVLSQIVKGAEKQALDKGLQFQYHLAPELPKLLTGDPARLGQIVNNVLGNAVKFTPQGFVKMDVFALDTDETRMKVAIEISDSGVGIPAEQIEGIFEAFTQNNITDKRKFGGFGLGLSIVKKLIDLHGGIIEFQSETDRGTICRIELDYAVPAQPKPVVMHYPTDDYDLLGKHILVVEDNDINQMVMRAILKKWKNTTFSFANDGEEGVRMAREEAVDLILMDLQMPVMDGYEAAIAIRAGEAGFDKRNIPIIAVTADVMEATRQRVLSIGMNDYLTKPVDKDKLYHHIIRLLSQNPSQRAHQAA